MTVGEYLERIDRGACVLLAACVDEDISDAEYEVLRQATREQCENTN